jgi:hypothetical protein
MMKKLIALTLPISLLMFACSSPSNQSDIQSQVTPDTEVTATKEAKIAKVTLVSPQGDIPMGDAELILEVQDSASGKVIGVEMIEVSSTMPMEGEDPMLSKVEIEPTDTRGQFKIKTNFSMAGTWNLATTVKDANYQGGNEITVEVK